MSARVNHKLVKQRLNEKRSSITDRQFFTSRILAGHFEDMAALQTRRYNYCRRVRVAIVWEPKNRNVACTDNMKIWINAGHQLITGIKGRENRYQIVCGLFAHELGHVLYTDFLSGQTHTNFLAAYRWYPTPPILTISADVRRENEFWEYVKLDGKNLSVVQEIAHHVSNILEDGYIENRMLNNFPGTLGCGLEEMRAVQFKEMPTVTQLIEREENGEMHICESIFQLLLSYAKFGEIKYGDEPLSDKRIKIVFGLLNDIDDAIKTRSAKNRLGIVNLILVRCWDYIKDYCELCKERQAEAEAENLSAEISETVATMISKTMSGGSSIGKGSSMPVPEKDGEEETSATAKSRASTKSDAESESEEKGSEGTTHAESEEKSGDDKSDGSAKGETGEEDGVDGEGQEQPPDVSETETGRMPLVQTSEVYVPEGGSIEHTEYKREVYEKAATDIDRMLDKMAERAACKEMENERLTELNEFAQNISYGNIHSGVNIRINRITEVDENLIEQYQAICEPLLNISRQLKKNLVKQLEESRRGGKQTGLLMGRRLDSHTIHRNDGKLFYKNVLPNETPELAVGLLLDESGSMASCDRCTYARAAAIILYDFCRSLDIPITVYGHSTKNGSYGDAVEIYSYAEFDSIDNDDRFRMMDIRARNSNRDGAPLRFVAEKLATRPEEVKLLILVSDGQPADSGYYGTAAEEDLRGIKKEYQRKGILFVAAAIGDDKQNIERIYGDSFMDITDLQQLPVKLTSIVKRHIRM